MFKLVIFIPKGNYPIDCNYNSLQKLGTQPLTFHLGNCPLLRWKRFNAQDATVIKLVMIQAHDYAL